MHQFRVPNFWLNLISIFVLSNSCYADTNDKQYVQPLEVKQLEVGKNMESQNKFKLSAEMDVLARLIHEMKYLLPLVDEAESISKQEKTKNLDYKLLKSDLNAIIEELSNHIHKPVREPRPIKSLNIKY